MMFRVLEFQEKRELHTKYTRTKRLISSWTLKEIKILLENSDESHDFLRVQTGVWRLSQTAWKVMILSWTLTIVWILPQVVKKLENSSQTLKGLARTLVSREILASSNDSHNFVSDANNSFEIVWHSNESCPQTLTGA